MYSTNKKIDLFINNSFSYFSVDSFETYPNFQNIFNELTKILSYEIPGASFSKLPSFLKTKYLFAKGKTNGHYYFPTGLLNKVLEYLNSNKIDFEIFDQRIKPKNSDRLKIVSKKLPKLREYQEKIVLKTLKDYRGVIESATGTGKTRILIELISRLNLKTLVVVPSLSILEQTKNQLIESFGKNKVSGINNKNKQIIIANYQSLEKIDDDFWKSVDVLIIDEFHHAAANTFLKLNKKFNSIFYRVGLTGTFFRNDGTDLALQGVLSHVIYKYDAVTAINEGFLCRPKFYTVNYAHNGLTTKNSWLSEYKYGIVENVDYNKNIAFIANKLITLQKPTLIFVDEIAHGKLLENLIPKARFVNGTQKPEINNQLISDFNNKKLNCLIGTSVIGEGVDTVRAGHAIMAGVGKAKSEIIQKIGRVLRPHSNKNHAVIIDFIHNYRHFLYKHSLDRIEIYKEYQSDIFTITLDEINKIF
ncbi:MAG TPA: DEAD/DEAH box helicase [Chitinophagales bacterium]|nr:DEAD/DEAH box helicase [Chitinophagales bacterium]HMW93409.1 DEAD/DEAH box helicase [Chitinophagales bacterium]HMZ92968.1 DEAD/DEAH box helicase [Chitinophagales bacterium]HNG25968.1 DEAD/DEAH box helicase [Chitinophagales bacterium]